jgi:hypothetical protein
MDTIALAKFIKKNVETKFFTIWFEKKDGTIRQLQGKIMNENQKLRTTDDSKYLIVYDVGIQQYRNVNLNKIKTLHSGSHIYNFTYEKHGYKVEVLPR